ncbi:maleylacetoacetate isomerase [Bradyrhizobium sp. SYSU BS000235]|uniref:maleylacetoacetate isomerase n=1 Tax=Bradyrhizobium sp. SYSU BS000235 TaxID=3411332 RepID=UPI003C7349D7
MTIKLYAFWRSIASYRVKVALNLKGMDFEDISIDILSGEQFKPGYSDVNAEHVVPTLVHDGQSLFQSLAIIEYLDDIQPEPRLLPTDPKDRAYARALALVAIADSHPLIVPRVRKHLAQAFGADAKAIDAWAGHWTFEGLATYERLLSRRPAKPFAVGEAPTIADIAIAGQLITAQLFQLELKDFPLVLELSERCSALPAFAMAHPSKQPDFKKSGGSH